MSLAKNILDALNWGKLARSQPKDVPKFLSEKVRNHPDYIRLYGGKREPSNLLPDGFISLLGAFQYQASTAYLWDRLNQDFDPPYDRPIPSSKDTQMEHFDDGSILTNEWPDYTRVFIDSPQLDAFLYLLTER